MFNIYYILQPYLVSFDNNEIPRCQNNICRAYINPYVKWKENSLEWICNMCYFLNTTASFYYDMNNSVINFN